MSLGGFLRSDLLDLLCPNYRTCYKPVNLTCSALEDFLHKAFEHKGCCEADRDRKAGFNLFSPVHWRRPAADPACDETLDG
jgi:hypothetical protein